MKIFKIKMSISFKVNFHGKNKDCNYSREKTVKEAFEDILKQLKLYETTDPAVYSFAFGTRILNKSEHVNKKLKDVIRDNVTIKLMTKKDMGYS